MSEMVERVAEALFMARFSHEPHFNYQDSFEKDEYRKQARIAIDALREPTEAMRLEGAKMGGEECSLSDADSIWQAMIDEALK